MVRDPVDKFVSRYYYNRLVNIYPKLAKSKSPVIKYGSLTEKVIKHYKVITRYFYNVKPLKYYVYYVCTYILLEIYL